MLDAESAGSITTRLLLPPVSAANTAAATTSTSGGYADTRDFEGYLAVTQLVGAVTGSITGKLQSASDANGTGAADIAGATFTAVSAANDAQTIVIPKTAMTARYLGYVGTVVTGPALVGVAVHGSKKYI